MGPILHKQLHSIQLQPKAETILNYGFAQSVASIRSNLRSSNPNIDMYGGGPPPSAPALSYHPQPGPILQPGSQTPPHMQPPG